MRYLRIVKDWLILLIASPILVPGIALAAIVSETNLGFIDPDEPFWFCANIIYAFYAALSFVCLFINPMVAWSILAWNMLAYISAIWLDESK